MIAAILQQMAESRPEPLDFAALNALLKQSAHQLERLQDHSVMQTIVTIAPFITAIVACATFIRGLQAWKVELVGRRKAEVGITALAALYRAQAALQDVRAPISLANEAPPRTKGENEDPREQSCRDQYWLTWKRVDARREHFDKAHALRFECRAIFGAGACGAFDAVAQGARLALLSAEFLCDPYYWRPLPDGTTDEGRRRRNAEREKHNRQLWRVPGEDELGDRVDAAIAAFAAMVERATSPTSDERGGLCAVARKARARIRDLVCPLKQPLPGDASNPPATPPAPPAARN